MLPVGLYEGGGAAVLYSPDEISYAPFVGVNYAMLPVGLYEGGGAPAPG